MKETTAIILAGGKSSRMGTNKALLEFDGMTVIEQIVRECKKFATHILIVTNNFADFAFLNLPMVEDKQKGKGPLAGIQAGLSTVQTDKNVIIACDMPFVSADIAVELLKDLTDYDAVIPKINDQLHPLFAAYRKSCLDAVDRSLAAGDLRIIHFLSEVRVKTKTERDFPDHLETSFYNMNNPEQYETAMKMNKDQTE